MPGITERERALQDKRAQAYGVMKSVLEKYDDDNASLTVEDRKRYDDAQAELDEATGDLDRVRKYRQTEEGKNDAALRNGQTRDEKDSAEDRYAKAYSRYLRHGFSGMNSEDAQMVQATLISDEDRTENALSTAPGAGVDGSAGFLVPQGFWANLQIALKAYGGLLPLTNILETSSGQPLPWPTTDPTGQVGSYITENTQLTSSTTIEFGQGMLHAWFIKSGVILASLAIINDSAFDVDAFVTDRMGEQIGRKVAAELHGGAGQASQALTGINTSLVAWNQTNTAGATPAAGGYYQPANSETAFWLGAAGGTTATATLAHGMISWGSVLGMIGTIDPAYRNAGTCTFVMNDQTQQNLRQLTDGFGHPIWQPDLTMGPSDGAVARIQGFPVTIDQNASSVSTTGGTAGGLLFGDFKRAMVVRQVNQAGTMRLTERYADFLQVGYLGFVRMDALPNDLRAVAQYKSGAS
jgi:HK97 family phage major capsid protein